MIPGTLQQEETLKTRHPGNGQRGSSKRDKFTLHIVRHS